MRVGEVSELMRKKDRRVIFLASQKLTGSLQLGAGGGGGGGGGVESRRAKSQQGLEENQTPRHILCTYVYIYYI